MAVDLGLRTAEMGSIFTKAQRKLVNKSPTKYRERGNLRDLEKPATADRNE